MTEFLYRQLQNKLGSDLMGFGPELILCGAVVLVLLLRMMTKATSTSLGWTTLTLVGLAFAFAVGQFLNLSGFDPRTGEAAAKRFDQQDLFGGMLVFDNLSIWAKLFLLLFLAAVIKLCILTGVPDRDESADFLVLLLGATIGMMTMASSNHLLMAFLAVEMASLPSYAMAGFLKGNRKASEAALKYVVYGGGAAGVMLYGISLLAGKFGTAYLPDLLRFVAASLAHEVDLLVVMGLLFVLVGIAFKLSAVPFHFWCPDVFEGASAEVAGFLSVASKGAALALLARFALPLHAAADVVVPALAFLGIVTTTFGNLAAYSQTNLKRLLAYSTIAHAGFMIMGLATLRPTGVSAVLFYLGTYLCMNLGAFAVVAFLRNATGAEDIRDFRGLVHRAPVLVITLGVFLLSLLGLPPLAGFAAKFQIFAALFDALNAGPSPIVRNCLYALVFAGALNTVLALFYYVKVLKVMVIEKPVEAVEGRSAPEVKVPALQTGYAVALAVLVVGLGIAWNALESVSRRGAEDLREPPARAAVAQGAPR